MHSLLRSDISGQDDIKSRRHNCSPLLHINYGHRSLMKTYWAIVTTRILIIYVVSLLHSYNRSLIDI
jgi:hypothetical protein